MTLNDTFSKIAKKTSNWLGSPLAFVCSLLLIIAWASLGPYFKWSDSHSLFINTITTIITFLMVFLIQNSQNRDSMYMHLKIDELIATNDKSRNQLLAIDEKTDKELEDLEKEFKRKGKNNSAAMS